MVQCRNLYFYNMQKWLNGTGLLAYWTLLCIKVFAQPVAGNMGFEIIGEKKGLSHHIVYCLLQDKRGFVWAGTEYGLNRYDGISCTRFFAGHSEKSLLPDNHINRLAEDADGNIWVGTNRGISRINPLKGESRFFYSGEKDRAELKEISFQVFADKKGRIWAANGYFLFRFDPAKGEFSRFPVDCGQSTGNTRNYFILDFLEDKQGQIWLATSYGIKKFDTISGTVKSYHFPEQNIRLFENAVTSLAEEPGGQIVCGTWGGGILGYNPETDRFEKNPSASPGKELNIVLDIAFSENRLFLATGGGLVEADYTTGQDGIRIGEKRLYRAGTDTERGIEGMVVNCLMMDRIKNVWLGTNNKIARADLKMSHFQHFEAYSEGKSPLNPTTIMPDPATPDSGNYWVGSNGLYYVKQGTGIMEKMGLEKYIKNTEGQKSVWDIGKGTNGLWLATTGGLLLFDPDKKVVLKAWYPVQGNPETLPGERLWKVFEDKSGNVWIATIRRGISLLNPATGRFRNFFGKPGDRFTLFNKTPTRFFEDAEGNTWFGGDDLLYQYVKNADSFRVFPFRVPILNGAVLAGKPTPFMQDSKGNIWLTCADGIVSFNPRAGNYIPILTGVPFFKPVGDIANDALGQFWFGTSNGLFRWDSVTKNLTRFTTNDGLMSNETDGCVEMLPGGTMVIGSPGVITHFFPENLLAKEPAPAVALAMVQVNGRDTSISFEKPLILPHQSTLLFSYAALSFGNASQNQYMYMLKGVDKNWSQPVQSTTVTYAKLPAGNYTFLVKGCNSDGVWNPVPVSFRFRIEAPFYLTAWFLSLCALVVGMAIVAIYRYRLEQALRVERLRTRLATDLHDDVGATLSAISMYSESLKKQVNQPQLAKLLGKIGDDSREMVRAMGDLVWAINPGNDGGEKLLQRMENYATDLCAVKEITLHFQSDPKINTQSVGIETRRNIFLVYKEAINNALKYSGCTLLKIQIFLEAGKFVLVVEDNGSGFDVSAHRQGNGLCNMQTRAAEIGGRLTINSSSEKGGSSIILKCPL